MNPSTANELRRTWWVLRVGVMAVVAAWIGWRWVVDYPDWRGAVAAVVFFGASAVLLVAMFREPPSDARG